MTNCFKPTCYNNKAKQNQWLNCIFCTHDLICFCPNTTKHLLLALTEKGEKIEVTPEEKKQIIQCLTTTDDGADKIGDQEDAVDEIGLDALFTDDFTEEDG